MKNKLSIINKDRETNGLKPLKKDCLDGSFGLYEINRMNGLNIIYESGVEKDVDIFIINNANLLKTVTKGF